MIKVILLIDCASEHDRKLLRGMTRYSKENGPWLFYRVSPGFRFEDHREEWVVQWARQWGADAIIGRWDEKKLDLLQQLDIPVVLQNMITIGVNMLDTIMLGTYGETQLSGASMANEFISLHQILCLGIGGGAAVLTSQYWGAKDIPVMRRVVVLMLRISMVLGAVLAAAVLAFPEFITPELSARPKRGFGVPVAAWLRESWKLPAQEKLFSSRLISAAQFVIYAKGDAVIILVQVFCNIKGKRMITSNIFSNLHSININTAFLIYSSKM